MKLNLQFKKVILLLTALLTLFPFHYVYSQNKHETHHRHYRKLVIVKNDPIKQIENYYLISGLEELISAQWGGHLNFKNRETRTNSHLATSTLHSQKLLSFIHRIFEHIASNHYKLGGNIFNVNRGIYNLDCSEYLNELLRSTDPIAYQALMHATKDRPTSLDYFSFISSINPGESKAHWLHVKDFETAKAGDILIFRYKNLEGKDAAGHVMIIMQAPKKFKWASNAYAIRVSDSAPAGHSTDTRHSHTSGIGIGTLLIKTDPKTKLPVAYAWREFSLWHTDMYYVIARLQN